MLHNLFYDIMNVEFNLWPWIRNLVKYGDAFLALEILPGKGIINVAPHSTYNVERLEGTDPNNPDYVKYKIELDRFGKKEYEQYEMAHFRMLSDTNFLPYGKSMIEGARRIWKQLSLMEDAMLIHRIMRAKEAAEEKKSREDYVKDNLDYISSLFDEKVDNLEELKFEPIPEEENED